MNSIIGSIVLVVGLACCVINIIIMILFVKKVKAIPDGESVTELKRFEKPLKICLCLIIVGIISAVAGILIRGLG